MPSRKRNNARRARGGRSEPLRSYRVQVPSLHPPPRQRAASWRRVLQETVSVTPNQSTGFTAADWFQAKYSTSGFSSLSLLSVSAWSATHTADQYPTILIVPSSPGKLTDSGWSIHGVADLSTGRARVGYKVPPHLSGPFTGSETMFNITTSASSVTVEIACILM